MARRKVTPRSYFEPWTATKSAVPFKNPFADGIPEGANPEAAERVIDACERLSEQADWVIWGSKMADPAIAVDMLTGKPVVSDDRRIIAVRRTQGLSDKAPTNKDIAIRIADCVNACKGIADPVAFIEDARDLLRDCVRGEADPREDNRIYSLLGRCIPLEELEEINRVYGNDSDG